MRNIYYFYDEIYLYNKMIILEEKTNIKYEAKANHQPFFTPKHYLAYVQRTNEKYILHNILNSYYLKGYLPIKKGDKNKKILDLGAGLGTNTTFLQNLFPEHEIWAVEPNKEFCDVLNFKIVKEGKVIIENVAFEDFKERKFDFILVSHVLQYIDTSVISFVKKIIEILNKDGEAWVVLQEYSGINQIVEASCKFLENPSRYFSHWFIHNDLRKEFYYNNIKFRSQIFQSCFRPPEMTNILEQDINLLNFILVNGFDINNKFLLQSLNNMISKNTINNYMLHEVGISKISK